MSTLIDCLRDHLFPTLFIGNLGWDRASGSRTLTAAGQAHDEVHDEVRDEVLNETERRLPAALASGPQSRAEMAEMLAMKFRRSGHLSRAMERLRGRSLAELTIPDKPQSKNQKMRLTETGRAWLAAHRDSSG